MQGLIYNLLAELAERAGCQDEAWDVALRSALGEADDADDADDEADRESEEQDLPELALLGTTTGTTFRCLLRSAAPFRDEDWDDLAAAQGEADGRPTALSTAPSGAEGTQDRDGAAPTARPGPDGARTEPLPGASFPRHRRR